VLVHTPNAFAFLAAIGEILPELRRWHLRTHAPASSRSRGFDLKGRPRAAFLNANRASKITPSACDRTPAMEKAGAKHRPGVFAIA